jgi:hypothetical protein
MMVGGIRPEEGENEGSIPITGRSHHLWHVLSHHLIDAPASGGVCATASPGCGRLRRRLRDACWGRAPCVSARQAAHARFRKAKRQRGVSRTRTLVRRPDREPSRGRCGRPHPARAEARVPAGSSDSPSPGPSAGGSCRAHRLPVRRALVRACPLVVALHRDRMAVPEHLPVALAPALSCIAPRALYSEIARDNGCPAYPVRSVRAGS